MAVVYSRRHPHTLHCVEEPQLALLVFGSILEESTGLVIIERDAERCLAQFLTVGIFPHSVREVGVAGETFLGEMAHPIPHYGIFDEDRGDGGVDYVVGFVLIEDLVHGGLAADGGDAVFVEADLLGDFGVGGSAFEGNSLGNFEAVDDLDDGDID